jgi:hypothetical protein
VRRLSAARKNRFLSPLTHPRLRQVDGWALLNEAADLNSVSTLELRRVAAPTQEISNMKKTISAMLAVAAVAGSLVSVAPARAGGGGIAAGVAGGLIGGALIGGAIASSRPAYGYGPAPVYVEEPPPCRLVRERFWDGYGWRMRRVQVCD